MVSFLRALSNILGIAVTVLGMIAIFFKALDLLTLLIVFSILLFLGFVSLIVYQMNKLETKIDELEKKYKRADELIDIKSEIKNLKEHIT